MTTTVNYYTYWDEKRTAEIELSLDAITKLYVVLVDGNEMIAVYSGDDCIWVGDQSGHHDYWYTITGSQIQEWLEWEPDKDCLYPYPDQRLQKFTGVNINEPRN